MSDRSNDAVDSSRESAPDGWETIRAFLTAHPNFVRDDADLLAELGLRVRADNIVDFGPAALARLSADKTREKAARRQLEATAQANFAAQAQCHAAVVDLLESRNHADLARRVDETARLRFGLVGAVIAVERPGGVPAGWRGIAEGGADSLIGASALARMGEPAAAQSLFGRLAPQIGSVAMARMAIWMPARQGLLAFGSGEPGGFTADMGAELVAFLARVIERTAERWPVL
ncbi:MAG TPA: DUF484 family protein [Caulobacteraceae bacterium]|nr:DUF484 family protein [Caulobacteraceae bacterium]